MKKEKVTGVLESILLEYSIWIFFFLIVLLTTILAPGFLNYANIVSMLREAVVVGVIAIGMTLVLVCGCFDLSAGAIMGICCVVAMRLGPSDAKSTFIALAVPVILGIALGMVDGFIVGKLGLQGFIATLGMQYVILGATLLYTNGNYTTLAQYTSNYNNLYCWIGTATILGIPLQVYIMITFTVIGQLMLSYTKLGQHIKFAGENPLAATLSGISVEKTRFFSYAILGFCSAISGLILGSWVRQFEPQTGIGYEFEAITAVVLGGTSLTGGKGNILNSVIGAILMVMIVNAMIQLNISYNYQLMVRGIILIFAVTLQVYMRRKNT